jgi:hypothetical protein
MGAELSFKMENSKLLESLEGDHCSWRDYTRGKESSPKELQIDGKCIRTLTDEKFNFVISIDVKDCDETSGTRRRARMSVHAWQR